jgi:hypothetical protein
VNRGCECSDASDSVRRDGNLVSGAFACVNDPRFRDLVMNSFGVNHHAIWYIHNQGSCDSHSSYLTLMDDDSSESHHPERIR